MVSDGGGGGCRSWPTSLGTPERVELIRLGLMVPPGCRLPHAFHITADGYPTRGPGANRMSYASTWAAGGTSPAARDFRRARTTGSSSHRLVGSCGRAARRLPRAARHPPRAGPLRRPRRLRARLPPCAGPAVPLRRPRRLRARSVVRFPPSLGPPPLPSSRSRRSSSHYARTVTPTTAPAISSHCGRRRQKRRLRRRPRRREWPPSCRPHSTRWRLWRRQQTPPSCRPHWMRRRPSKRCSRRWLRRRATTAIGTTAARAATAATTTTVTSVRGRSWTSPTPTTS
ncbi:hypothetical protein CFC21_100625, partial [Triticum aestivum]